MLVLSYIGGDRSGSAELRIKETTTGQRSPQKHALLALIRRPELAPLAGAERGGETHGAQPNTGINTALADQATTIPVGIKRQGARTAQSNHLLLAGEHPPRGDLKRQFQATMPSSPTARRPPITFHLLRRSSPSAPAFNIGSCDPGWHG